MRSRRGIAGQASVELAGILALLAVVFVGLHALGLDGKITSAAKSALCSILDSACDDSKPAAAGDRTSSGTTGDDADGDGVSDTDEREAGTDPDTADTDGDGLPDGQERDLGTQPGDQDTDHDGIPDAEEADSGGKLDPTSADTDGDGLTDPEEIAVGTDPDDTDSDGALGDTGDGLGDKEEIDRGTDPTAYDSDGDSMPDGHEVANGDDPLKDERNIAEKALDELLDDPFGLGKGTVIKKGPKKLIEKLIKKGGKKGGSKLDEIEDLGERARQRRERLEALRKGRKQKVDDIVDEACSFAGGTLVLMADGSQRPIAQVRAGDRVIATDPRTGRRSARGVTERVGARGPPRPAATRRRGAAGDRGPSGVGRRLGPRGTGRSLRGSRRPGHRLQPHGRGPPHVPRGPRRDAGPQPVPDRAARLPGAADPARRRRHAADRQAGDEPHPQASSSEVLGWHDGDQAELLPQGHDHQGDRRRRHGRGPQEPRSAQADRQRARSGPRRGGRPGVRARRQRREDPPVLSRELMPVEIRTVLGNPKQGFTPIEDVERYDGDPEYVEGSMCVTVDGVPFLAAEDWDDVNWLWPFVVKASQAGEETGYGETMFPDQPLKFSVERLGGSGRIRLSLTATGINRTAVASASEYYEALADAGLRFFEHLERLAPGAADTDREQIAVLRRWKR